MTVFPLEDFPVFKLLDLKVIEFLFKKLAGFEKGSFNVYKHLFSDGSFSLWISYPTDLNDEKMSEILKVMTTVIKLLELDELLNLVLEKN